MRLLRLFGILVVLGALAVSQADTTPGSSDDGLYRLGPGDVIDVRVVNRPQLSLEAVRVDDEGKIRLPMIAGDVAAGCRTEDELARVIADKYREYLVDPQVLVSIRKYSSQIVNLVGAVQKPGSFQLERRVRLRELVAIAGGPSPAAGDTIMIVKEKGRAGCGASPNGADDEVKMVSTALLLAGDNSSNPYVSPGDFIHAGEAGQAYVVGNVYKPSPIYLAQPITLTRALAMAGGELPGSRDSIRIVRRASEGQSKLGVLPFGMKAILSNKEEDPLLREGDIVEVDVSITKSILKTMVGAFASVGAVYYPLVYIH